MTVRQAINTALHLQQKWVGRHPAHSYDFERIQASIRSELKANREMPGRCTAGCKRETRADAILLGKARKLLTPEVGQ